MPAGESDNTSTLSVEVWRGGADGGFRRHEVPRRGHQTVLDVVTWIQRHRDSGLSYRFACRVGMCGTCAMQVNGRPRWTCRSHVARIPGADKGLRIAPLANLPIIKDLVVDLAPFFAKWQAARGTFSPTGDRTQPMARVRPNDPKRRAADAGIECITCAVCHAACDVVRWNPDYLGPAALNRAWTLQNDVRDSDFAGRKAAIEADAGCHACHSEQNCTDACPNLLDPSGAIAGLKRQSLPAWLGGDSR